MHQLHGIDRGDVYKCLVDFADILSRSKSQSSITVGSSIKIVFAFEPHKGDRLFRFRHVPWNKSAAPRGCVWSAVLALLSQSDLFRWHRWPCQGFEHGHRRSHVPSIYFRCPAPCTLLFCLTTPCGRPLLSRHCPYLRSLGLFTIPAFPAIRPVPFQSPSLSAQACLQIAPEADATTERPSGANRTVDEPSGIGIMTLAFNPFFPDLLAAVC